MKRIIIILILTILLSGCVSSEKQTKGNFTLVEDSRIPLKDNSLEVVHDDSRNVTCWVIGMNQGISCIPDSQLGN